MAVTLVVKQKNGTAPASLTKDFKFSELTPEEKSKLLGRKWVPTDSLVPQKINPNKMKPREFDLLVANIQENGLTEPILVRPLPDGRSRIIGGFHRWEAAKYLGFAEVPVTEQVNPEFDDDMEAFQIVRMNVIHGHQDPVEFTKLYSQLAGKYADDILQESFGFADEAEFRRLIKATAKTLPQELQKQFIEAAKEIKTIDGLAKLLNDMFAKYGDTLPFGYMVFDYGGQRSVWMRIESKKTMEALDAIGLICIENKRCMEDIVGGVLQLIANGSLSVELEGLIVSTPEVNLKNIGGLPTRDAIQQAGLL